MILNVEGVTHEISLFGTSLEGAMKEVVEHVPDPNKLTGVVLELSEEEERVFDHNFRGMYWPFAVIEVLGDVYAQSGKVKPHVSCTIEPAGDKLFRLIFKQSDKVSD